MKLFALAALPLLAPAASFDEVFNALEQTHTFTDVHLSPDTKWAGWMEHAPNGTNRAVLLNLASSAQATIPGAGISSICWAPDSSRIAFFTERNGQRDVQILRIGDTNPEQVSHLNGHAEDLHWSADGRSIAFLYAENGTGGGPLRALEAQVGEIGEHPHNQRITILSLDNGSLHSVTPESLNVYEFDWAKDGHAFTGTAAPGPADNNWWTAKLYTFPASGADAKVIYAPPPDVQLELPRWSPDSKHIAFVGGIMSDEGAVGGDVYVVSEDGGAPKDWTPAMHASARRIDWTGPNTITASLERDGASAFARIQDGHMEMLWNNPGTVSSEAVSEDGKTAILSLSSWDHPPTVYKTGFSTLEPLEHVNDALKPMWGTAKNLTWTSGPFHAQGWLLFPANYDPQKKYPMIVSVHGGPASMRGNQWPSTHFDMSVFSALGYFVFFPNPRGSYGEGEAYTRGNIKDFGHGDLRDVMLGVDKIVQEYPVDNARLGVTGWSYGGYMTMWTVTQTHRFHAAVAGAGIANWLSYYGENSIDQWMIPYFGAPVYSARAAYDRSSPIDFINQVKTPTLVLVGERDAECPAPQSFEFWHALRDLGIPTRLVVYQGEGHGFTKDADQRDRMRRTADWFEKYLR